MSHANRWPKHSRDRWPKNLRFTRTDDQSSAIENWVLGLSTIARPPSQIIVMMSNRYWQISTGELELVLIEVGGREEHL